MAHFTKLSGTGNFLEPYKQKILAKKLEVH